MEVSHLFDLRQMPSTLSLIKTGSERSKKCPLRE